MIWRLERETYLKAGWSEGAALMRYAVVIEKAEGNYSAYVPDLPGCVATGESVQAVEAQIREAIRFHIDGLKADGLAIPQPTSIADYVDA
jgi:predicted RNase H-like HicB family nuclease